MAISGKKVVLVAVLDWGLGHASRSIPLIHELQKQGAQVILASNGRAGLLLQKHFPDLLFLKCPAYDIHYRGENFYLNILRQLPKIFSAIFQEHRWLARMVKGYQINAVISDSRFGCYHSTIPSVLLTHQLHLPLQPPVLAHIVNWFYCRWLRRFQEIWVPDSPDGLSGALSHPSPFKITHFVGCLSRFVPLVRSIKWDLLVLLSGPEPQRTHLEEIVLSQLQHLEGLKVLLVQGKTEEEDRKQVNDTIEVVSYLSGKDLLYAIAASEVVLCRSGYSSLMDLAVMGKPAILVPTPGQPEQEYLAQRCLEKSWAVVQQQDQLAIEKALELVHRESRKFPISQNVETGKLETTIGRFLQDIP